MSEPLLHDWTESVEYDSYTRSNRRAWLCQRCAITRRNRSTQGVRAICPGPSESPPPTYRQLEALVRYWREDALHWRDEAHRSFQAAHTLAERVGRHLPDPEYQVVMRGIPEAFLHAD